MENGNMRLSKLYYKGTWILRTTETGIEVNGEVAWYRIVWAYTKYLWFKVRAKVRDWLKSQARGNLGRQ